MIRSYPKCEIDENLLKKREWREFWSEDLFNVKGTITTHPSQLIKNGKTPRVTCAATNNAIDDFYQNFPTENGKVITIDSATIGYVSYQESDFIATDHVEKLILKDGNLNKFKGLFFISCINSAIKNKYNYGYKFSQTRIKRQKIILPVKNNNPDYEFMQNFIKEIEKLKLKRYLAFVKDELKNLEYKEIPKLDEVEWSEFNVNELFDIVNSKPYHKKDLDFSKKELPYITRTNLNNGIEDLVSKKDEFLINPKNTIVFGAENVKFFFEPFEYITGNKMYVVKLKEKEMNKYTGLFLITSFDKSVKGCGFGYGQGLTGTREKRRKLLLPTKNNQPDFDYMEQFIKNMFIQKYKKYLNFIS